MATVLVHELRKSYNGKIAVEDVSFVINPGEIFGLIGPNGAGKSSTIKMILDFIRPDSGDIEVFGGHMDDSAKNRIGYLPEEKGLYKKLAAIDQIVYLASLKGMEKKTAMEKARLLLEESGMIENRKMKIKNMSKGMGQVIQFIVTIIHDPQLIILDEPFSGLDPVNTDRMKRKIAELRDEGKAIILSTHQMNQVEELCDRILMIHHGREVLSGNLNEIKSGYRKHSVLVNVEGEIGDLPGVIEKQQHRGGVELILAPDAEPQTVLDQLRGRNVVINRFEITTPTLNDIFLDVVGAQHE